MSEQVQGFCPMGCGATLFLGSDGYVTCSWSKCPNRGAASDVLLIKETWHVALLEERTYRLVHPVRCRLAFPDLDCPEDRFLKGLDGPPRKPGKYRFELANGESPEFIAQKLAALAAETIIDVAVERYGDNGQQWHGVI